jgi:glycosyltransferase involved in cell wall biosynthesis
MNIDVHITCWNEQAILPFTLQHYSSFCDRIYVHDNMSSDNSLFICNDFPKVTVKFWDSKTEKGKFNDNEARHVKYTAYNEYSKGKADWVILADCDELIYHPDIKGILKTYKDKGVNYPVIQGAQMTSHEFPKYESSSNLTDIVKTGVLDDPFPPDEVFIEEKAWGFSKPIIFNPELDVFLSCGSHFINGEKSNPSEFVFSEQAELKLLHYKYLSEDYVVNRYKQLGVRLSKYNLDREYGLGWVVEENKIREQHRAYLSLATQVI